MIMRTEKERTLAQTAATIAQPFEVQGAAGIYTLERTTDPRVIEGCHRLNANTWANELTIEQYVERERFMSKMAVTNVASTPDQDGKSHIASYNRAGIDAASLLKGIAYYVMRDRSVVLQEGDDPMANVVCACETLGKEGYIAHPSASGAATITTMVSPCIGGVFVPEKSRGLSLGSIMITQLVAFLTNAFALLFEERVSPANPTGETFSTLYSEVGEYYRKFGYHSRSIDLITIDYSRVAIPAPAPYTFRSYKVGDDTSALHALHARQTRAQLVDAVNATGYKHIANVPTVANFNWHCFRSIYISESLKVLGDRNPQDELVFAISAHDTSTGNPVAFATFTHDWSSRTVYLLKVVVVVPQASKAAYMGVINSLLQEIRRETHAKYGGFEKFKVWQSELLQYGIATLDPIAAAFAEQTGSAADIPVVASTNGSVSAARFHNYTHDSQGVVVELPETPSEEVSFGWVDNGKWCWF